MIPVDELVLFPSSDFYVSCICDDDIVAAVHCECDDGRSDFEFLAGAGHVMTYHQDQIWACACP